MCLEGGCGCCVVSVVKNDTTTNERKSFAINSCMVSVFSCENWQIFTIEGIGGPKTQYNEIQELLAEENGTQCGYCSSGMVMNMYALKSSGVVLTEKLIEDSFGGNICRCTGYRPILKAFKSLAVDDSWDIEDVMKCRKTSCGNCPEIGHCKSILELKNGRWIKVFDVVNILVVLRSINDLQVYMLVAGNTGKGVYLPSVVPDLYIDVSEVKELTSFSLKEDNLLIGANITLNNAIEIFKETARNNEKFAYLSQIAEHIQLVANPPIRNIATLAGNLMVKHEHPDFPSDIFLTLETANASLIIVDVDLVEQTLSPGEFLHFDMHKKIIKTISLKGYDKSYLYGSYKIMPRSENAHALVNAGFLFQLNDNVTQSARIVFGNINPNFVHATNTEALLTSKLLFNNELLLSAYQSLNQEINPVENLPEPSPEFRKNLAISLFYKFILCIAPTSFITSVKNRSGGTLLERPLSKAIQLYKTNPLEYPVSKPIIKLEALAQTSGQAEFIYDQPDRPNQVYASFVLAQAPAGSTILNVDISYAKKLPGFVAYYSASDVPGKNSFFPGDFKKSKPEELFCSGKVLHYSQPIGIVVAESFDLAEQAADLVNVTFKKSSTKPLLCIKDVLNSNAEDRIKQAYKFKAEKKGHDVKYKIKGETYLKEQYHFHMEVQCCNVIPTEDSIDIYGSTQWMDGTQYAAAEALNWPASKINVFVRRLGGGFGAKISRNFLPTTAATIAAFHLNRPVKMYMTLRKNMMAVGKRAPTLCQYDVGVNNDGVIQYLNAKLYTDYGLTTNDPIDFLVKGMFPNAYLTETWNWEVNNVTTDKPSNCYTRGPGSVEALTSIESIMEHIAYTIGKEPIQVKNANFKKDKFPQVIQLVDDLTTWCDYTKRKQSVDKFNEENRWKKRGIGMVPMAWFLELNGPFQCMVCIYHNDGTVAITHGGIECGQGINTKIAQVCAYTLKIPLNMIQVKPSNTTCVPNSWCTSNSQTSESVCYAVIQICEKILKRMKPIKDELGDMSWVEWVKACYKKVQLFDVSEAYADSAGRGNYYLYGVCAAEVELDVLTGQHKVSRVDLIQDPGQSMSPLIDIGQVEGAFIMGLGYHTIEDIVMSDEGKILTNRTWNYHVPLARDIPIDFRVQLTNKYLNKVGVLHSKAVGEPSTCLAVTIAFAIRNAMASARRDSDSKLEAWYPIDGCTSVENIFINSANNFQQYTL